MDVLPSTERTNLTVHRCRFVDWTPSEITAVAFSPLAPPNSSSTRSIAPSTSSVSSHGILAVGRGNGVIEICEWSRPEVRGNEIASQGWTIRRVLAGPNPSKVDSLAFALKDPYAHPPGTAPGLAHLRLFSTVGGKDLLEWDLSSGSISRVMDSDGGAIWALAVNPTSTILALGCDDGSIRLFSLENDEVTPLRRLDRVKARILSLAWAPPRYVPKASTTSGDASDSDNDDDDDESKWKDTFIIAGCSDSSIRKWDINSGRVLERMTTDQVRHEKTLVWAVGVLLDGTIVTGDSLGCVKFWDPMTSTQLFSFQSHDADVLCLSIGPDFRSVYASGVDQKVSEFALVSLQASAGTAAATSQSKWIHTRARRMHAHDVRAMAIWPPAQLFPRQFVQRDSQEAPILVSGGLDMSLTVTAIAPPSPNGPAYNPFARGQAPSIEDAFYRKMTFAQLGASGGRVVQCAPEARYVMCRHDTKISIWRIAPRRPDGVMPEAASLENEDGEWQKVVDMELRVDTTLVTSAISSDGKWLAVSDAYETKLFRLLPEVCPQALPKRIKNFTSTLQSYLNSLPPSSLSAAHSTAATAMIFTPDSRRLILAVSSLILIVDLNEVTSETGKTAYTATVIRSFPQHRGRRGQGDAFSRIIKPLPSREGVPMEEDVPPVEETNEESDDLIGSSFANNDSSPQDMWPIVSHLAISSDGQWLASSDLHGRTHIFNLDAIKHHCTLPTSPIPPTSLTFDIHPAFHQILVLAFPNNSIQVFDVENREYPTWARSVNEQLPYGLSRLQDPLAGVSFIHEDPTESLEASSTYGSRRSLSLASDRHTPRNVILWGRSWLCKIDLMSGGIYQPRGLVGPGAGPQNDKILKRGLGEGGGKSGSRRQPGRETASDAPRPAQVVTKYHDIMLVDFLGPKEMIVVERPIFDVLQGLRPAFYRAKYGSK
ncbi:WD40 repeat-like protein [Clavulina sp. PMI_390]|nr:WD40 repeat-like protein [Clavulina sp. PMI_390]